jgi:hypothetical protein
MAYVFKDNDGNVVGFSRHRCDDSQEWVEADEPALWISPRQQLAALDADNALTQRNLRETVMLMAEAFKTLSGGAVDLAAIPGVAKVYEVEAQAAALRNQL